MRALSNPGFAVSIATLGTIKDCSLRSAASVLAALALMFSANALAQSTMTFVGSSDNPSTVGASVTFSASVNANTPPNGTVNFTNGGTSMPGCSASILTGNGSTKNAYCTTSALPAGTHSIVGTYSGDGTNAPSTSPAISQVVNGVPGTTTSTASSLNPAALGASVTFTATVTGSMPSGTVNFTRGGTSLSGCSARTLSGSGNTRTATCTTTTLPAGTHNIVAAYSGNASNAPSTSPGLSQVVALPSTTTALASSLNPAAPGASVTLTASVTGNAPTGTVNFRDGGTSISGCSSRSLSGSGNTRTATCTTSTLSVGTHSIVASYSGNASNAASSSGTLSQSVTGTPNFVDVPTGHVAYDAVRAIAYHSISLGCASNPMRFCPDGDVGRDEMAVFLERAMRGIGYPFAPTGTLFSDVPMANWAVGPIEQLFDDGVTLGCGASPLRYCPDANVTRAEMAIFLLKARHGANYNPGGATGLVFSDVPASHWAAAWIEEFAELGYTAGCRSTPLDFCPNDPVTRAQMALFLQRVFNLIGPP